jgi:hypothetical protein
MDMNKVLINNGGTQVAEKNRERLTVYVDEAIYNRFRQDADSMYRSLSDHMNAILAEYYKNLDIANSATKADKGKR